MSAAARAINTFTASSARDVLIERAEARAYLWSIGEINTIPAAIDPLQEFAEDSGLVAKLGQDHVQLILADAFQQF